MPLHCAAIKDSASKERFTTPNKCCHTETQCVENIHSTFFDYYYFFKIQVTSKNGIIKPKAYWKAINKKKLRLPQYHCENTYSKHILRPHLDKQLL